MSLSGGASAQDTTDAAGAYVFGNMQGGLNYTVTPSKVDDIGALSISCFDAALAAQHAVGLTTLTPAQQRAADVDEDGNIFTFDAALICRYAVSLPPFNSSDQTGEWRFAPVSRSYTPLLSAQTNEDYTGTLLGDVDGNWTPAASMVAKGSARHIYFSSKPEWSENGKEMSLGLFFDGEISTLSFQMDLEYDADALRFVDTVSLLAGWQLVKNDMEAGFLRLGLYSTEPLEQRAKIVQITWEGVKEESTRIRISRALIDAQMQAPIEIDAGIKNSIPTEFALHQNYPNPFNPATRIRFDLPGTGSKGVKARLSIYNINGQLVRVLFDERRLPGIYELGWDGRNDLGVSVPSGVYFYTLKADDFKSTKKMLIIR